MPSSTPTKNPKPLPPPEDAAPASTAQANGEFGMLIVAALAAFGVRHFVISPGSRSTPLALAVARLCPDVATVIADERSAAFYALGRIKAGEAPVALICTSGSALAHYFPAVVEAHESCLPLLVLSADRPAELRACHAGQTINQVNFFHAYARYAAELPAPEGSIRDRSGTQPTTLARQVRELCRMAVTRAQLNPGGPVQLNCPFREPLYEPEVALDCAAVRQMAAGWGAAGRMAAPRQPVPLRLPPRTLVLCGAVHGCWDAPRLEQQIVSLAATGLPVLADAASPLRHQRGRLPCLISHYELVLRAGQVPQPAPEAILIIGEPPVSKLLRNYLAALDLPGWQFGPGKPGINPVFGRVEYCGDVQADAFVVDSPDCGWAQAWLAADRAAADRLDGAFAAPHALFEGDVHRALAALLPPATPLVLANSMAIRDAEWFFPPQSQQFVPFSQRGANGIDGTLSLARGVAGACCRPAVLVIGDLALLHDANGLIGAANDPHGLLVILVNNRGGGIFEFLAVAEDAAFERFFATPQAVDFGLLVAAHGGRHRRCDTMAELCDALQNWDQRGLCVLELPIQRNISKALHREFLQTK